MSLVWMNGAQVTGALAIDAHERGLLLGDGIFETICVLNKKPLWFEAHLARLQQAAAALGFVVPLADIRASVTSLMDVFDAEAGALRITLTRGVATRGLAGDGVKPTLLITLDPFARTNFFQSASLALSSIRRNPSAPSSRFKTTSYIDAIAAAREVVGKADDALLLNCAGQVACSSIANIFLVEGQHLVTPSLDQGILPGIMRKSLLQAAPRHGFTVEETTVPLARLLAADGAFLTNSLRFLRPVTVIEEKAFEPAAVAAIEGVMRDLLADEAQL